AHLRAIGIQVLEHALQVADVREHGAVEQRARTASDEQGREVFDVFVAQQLGVILDVGPNEQHVGVLGRQFFEARLVAATGVAPGSAEAYDQSGVRAVEQREQAGGVGVGGVMNRHVGKTCRVCL